MARRCSRPDLTAATGRSDRGRNYIYDALYRLEEAQELAPDGTVSLQSGYTYDVLGNRISRVTGAISESYAYDSLSNQLDSVALKL